MRKLFALVVALLTLSGCGSVPPTPVERFYRLQAVTVGTQVSASKAGLIAVLPLQAESLYAERPIIFVDQQDPRQLRQYHYHLWLYPPARTIEDHLITSLRARLVAHGESGASRMLEGRVLRFERVVSGKASKAVVALRLRLIDGGKALPAKNYEAEQAAGDESLPAFVTAMEQALAKIYAELAGDLDGKGG